MSSPAKQTLVTIGSGNGEIPAVRAVQLEHRDPATMRVGDPDRAVGGDLEAVGDSRPAPSVANLRHGPTEPSSLTS